MSKKFYSIVFAFLLVGSVVSPVVAQSNTTESGNAPTEIKEEVSENLYVQNYQFNPKNSTVTITFNQYDSSNPVRVSLANFLYEIDGTPKEYVQSTYTVKGETTVTFNLKQINGEMAVLIQEGGNAKLLTYSSQLFNFTNEYNSTQTGIMFLAGGMLGVTGVTIIAIKRKWEMQTEIRRRL